MALVRVEIRAGKSAEYKKALLDGIHRSLVEAIRIPTDDRFQRLYELDSVNFIAPSGKTELTFIEITMFPGRSKEAKKRLYRVLTDNLAQDPGIGGQDLIIVIHEPPLSNWGIRGGQPADEIPGLLTGEPRV